MGFVKQLLVGDELVGALGLGTIGLVFLLALLGFILARQIIASPTMNIWIFASFIVYIILSAVGIAACVYETRVRYNYVQHDNDAKLQSKKDDETKTINSQNHQIASLYTDINNQKVQIASLNNNISAYQAIHESDAKLHNSDVMQHNNDIDVLTKRIDVLLRDIADLSQLLLRERTISPKP